MSANMAPAGKRAIALGAIIGMTFNIPSIRNVSKLTITYTIWFFIGAANLNGVPGSQLYRECFVLFFTLFHRCNNKYNKIDIKY